MNGCSPFLAFFIERSEEITPGSKPGGHRDLCTPTTCSRRHPSAPGGRSSIPGNYWREVRVMKVGCRLPSFCLVWGILCNPERTERKGIPCAILWIVWAAVNLIAESITSCQRVLPSSRGLKHESNSSSLGSEVNFPFRDFKPELKNHQTHSSKAGSCDLHSLPWSHTGG